MAALYLAIALGVIAAVGILATVWSLAPPAPTNADLVEGRLRLYEAGPPISVTEMELQVPFADRVVRPILKRIGNLVERTMPANVRQEIHSQLQLAGRPGGLSTNDFVAVRYVLTGALCGLGILIGVLSQNHVFIALGALVGAAAGLYLPTVWLRRQVNRRRTEIQLDLPDVIDVLVVCVEAGLTFDAAMERVVEKYDHALANEFGRVMQEVRLGRSRLEALADLGARTGVEELNNFVQAIIQSEQLGSGVSKILRLQSDEARQRRLVSAQERGAQASLKMLLPMIGCIFPTLWVILLGPAGLLVLKFLRGG